MPNFKLKSNYSASGDQPEAIDKLVAGLKKGLQYQTLLGVTGSGKTFTMASIIEKVQKPTLIISPNKTLAAQLCQEFRSFFPDAAVEYFVSFYDYYQPEAYIARTDTYIEKDSSKNDEIDRLRNLSTMSLFERSDVIIVASVSCIYGLGSPENYLEATVRIRIGDEAGRDKLIQHLIAIKYERNDYELARGRFRVRGDILEIMPSYEQNLLRIEFFGDKIEKLSWVDPISSKIIRPLEYIHVYPGTHYVTFQDRLDGALKSINEELQWRLKEFKKQNKLVEAQRLEQRTKYDMEMIREMGYCNGIENYSRHLDGRLPGQPSGTLIDYFPKDFLLFVDESHVAIPQVKGMYEGDKSRKEVLVEYGFRLPSALDNRPLKFDEFEKKINQAIFVSATPAIFEMKNSKQIVEQIIRPTGLIDPEVKLEKTKNQIDKLLAEIKKRVKKKERVLITTLTKRMSEDLSEYLSEKGIKVKYLHSDIVSLDRIDILRGLRLGEFDVLVGINLLREGLDLPEVSLVAILDADKEGFLRGETSLIQTIGRAARNVNGQVILFADKITESMRRALLVTNRRRKIQIEYNKKNNITPQTIVKEIKDIREGLRQAKAEELKNLAGIIPKEEVPFLIKSLDEQMKAASIELNFEEAAKIRDKIKELKKIFKI